MFPAAEPRRIVRVAAVLSVAAFAVTAAIGAPRAEARDNDESLKDVATQVVWGNARGQYGRVWLRLHPRYRQVTTRTFWEACQRKSEFHTTGVEVLSVKVIDSYPDTIVLPLLGRVHATAVTLTMRYRHPALGTNSVTDTVYYTKGAGHWFGLWEPETYRAYAAHRCPK